mmetsp:Transcript_28230/g.34249  ORF Transcript_28230/g.34249 Transcript_28230/m.34249 type:complete len:207 (+) Transcript_28230:108-728(+)|eukprot:CAMPEP_0197868864 /NCGR_PEP_ID=MMETSP1438-20131217/45510_1 /TAXON_ID=1461541 /ORGANISM="Pterosperma sp., Strain CCMP1384" /LENGTH=206 /DNA_ID=CAMNT_0043487595 /DNA_START=105 /DNA_END=725 /DNA_ORIENTATION=+
MQNFESTHKAHYPPHPVLTREPKPEDIGAVVQPLEKETAPFVSQSNHTISHPRHLLRPYTAPADPGFGRIPTAKIPNEYQTTTDGTHKDPGFVAPGPPNKLEKPLTTDPQIHAIDPYATTYGLTHPKTRTHNPYQYGLSNVPQQRPVSSHSGPTCQPSLVHPEWDYNQKPKLQVPECDTRGGVFDGRSTYNTYHTGNRYVARPSPI